ncbi:ER membrane protein complex subunit 1 isoform X1 [Procambarus clarkii]|uniref:ER membrane protein complex subunit 1 isoform X1 n=1 Tax=Procambarus clarkii TaxID=6728 RepID=UPI00374205DE
MAGRWTLTCVILLLTGLGSTYGLYEDQIGKFDWVQQYVGVVEHAVFDESSMPARRIIVATAQNVLAALSTKNGDIAWRHVMETSDSGKVDLLASEGPQVITVAGNLLRTWDAISAALNIEIQLDHSPAAGVFQRAVSLTDSEVVLAELIAGSVMVTTFDRSSGAALDHETIVAPWLNENTKCSSIDKTLVCLELSLNLVFTLPLTAASPAFLSQPLASIGLEDPGANSQVTLQKVPGSTSHLVIQVAGTRKLVHIHEDGLHLVLELTGTKASSITEGVLYTITQTGRLVTIEAVELESGNELGEQGVVVELPFQSGTILSLAVYRFERRDGGMALRAFVTCSDHALHLISSAEFRWDSHWTRDTGKLRRDRHATTRQSACTRINKLASRGNPRLPRHIFGVNLARLPKNSHTGTLAFRGVVWSREEALASVIAVEAVDLPVDGANINYHEQLPPRTGLVGSLVHRVKTQCSQIAHWFSSMVGSSDSFQASLHTLKRDELNLRKLLVVATGSGKILGVDSWNGDVVWSIYRAQLAPLQGSKLLLYSQRTSAHFPHQPQCVVVGRHKVTGEGLLVVFNPISGTAVGDRGDVIPLGYQLSQALLMHHADEQYLKPLMLVDKSLVPRMFPASGEKVVLEHKQSIFLHLTHPGSSVLTGYSLRFSQPGALTLTEVWTVSLGGGPITGVYGKLAYEKVHSPGRVLADRSVLYKYVNPNLAVVTTQGYDHINKNTLTLYLVDTVTGAVIESVSHKKVSGPIHIVHSENWVVYTCFNDKYRRFEVTSLELFEGLSQANATAFSSFAGRATPPILERQAYILPMGVQATAHTTTEKGITTKFILFALQSGNVLQMSKWLLDPRRPMTGGPREEGLMPYMPELRISPHEMITYNHTLPRISGIYTSPTGLESACLVLVYGLDLFYTRVFPSKMFDVLKDDFDHYLISGALLALVAAALITRKLAQKKALRQAWK